MQFGFAPRALATEQEPVVERRRVIDSVGVANERVREAAQIEQSVPVGVVSGQARNFQAEHDADVSKADFRGKAREARPFDNA